MRGKRIAEIVLLLLAFVLPAIAQEPTIEYGQASELLGVTKVFVDTGVDTQQRELIVKEIHKRLPTLEVVSRPEESDIHLRFSLKEVRDGRTEAVGTIVKLVGHNRARVLFSFKDNMLPIFDQGTGMNAAMDYAKPHIFVREFVKVYRKANG